MRERVREIEFDVDAYTARLIGRENVSKLEGAVLEVVRVLPPQRQNKFQSLFRGRVPRKSTLRAAPGPDHLPQTERQSLFV